MPFNGVVIVSQNPVTNWERYAQMLSRSVDEGALGYRSLSKEERAEGGYWRSRFRIYGPREFLTEFIRNALGRQVEILNPDGRQSWEGFIYEMRLETGTATLRVSLDTLANKVWARYQITGSGSTSRSTVVEDEDSQNRYGIKEFVLGCGELEAATIANQVASQILNLRKSPQPTPVAIKIGKGLLPEPYIELQCRGYIDTLWWRAYNNAGAPASQGASAQVADIIGERAGVEIGYPAVWDQTADFEEGDLTDFDALSPGLAWDQEFDEEIADFDAVSPAWDRHADFEEGDLTDFDAEVDVDGDLNAAMAAAYAGTWGARFTFDDNTVAYGKLNFGAIDQTSGIFSFMIRLNAYATSVGITANIANIEGGGTSNWYMGIQNNGGDYRFEYKYRTDIAGVVFNYSAPLADATWYKVLWMWQAATAPGANDGWIRVYLDDVLEFSATGIDNDTRDGDWLIIGMTGVGGAIFGGTIDYDEIYLDPVGAPMVDKLAVKEGTYGLAIPINDATARYASFTDPAAEAVTAVEFWLDPNSIEMATNDRFQCIYAFDAGASGVWSVDLTYDGSNYKMRASIENDANGWHFTTDTTITDGYHHVRIVWAAATAPGADNGYIRLFIDGVLTAGSQTGIDNDTKETTSVRYGAIAGIDAGTYGVIYFDDCRWNAGVGPMDAYSFARRIGNYGMAIFIPNTTARYGELTDPANETEITVECWIDPYSITMAAGDFFVIVEGRGSGAVATSVGINLEYRDGAYELSLFVYDDNSILLTSEPITITDSWHRIRVVWKAATGVGEDDGRAYLFSDGGKISEIEGVDNDGYDVDSVRFGAVSGLDAGTTGIIFLDQCRWSDDVVMTITAESGKGQFVAKSTLRTNSTLVSEIYDADRLAGDIVFDIARLGDATYKRYLIYMFDDRELIYGQAAQPERG